MFYRKARPTDRQQRRTDRRCPKNWYSIDDDKVVAEDKLPIPLRQQMRNRIGKWTGKTELDSSIIIIILMELFHWPRTIAS